MNDKYSILGTISEPYTVGITPISTTCKFEFPLLSGNNVDIDTKDVKVLFNQNATILVGNGAKSVVKKCELDEDDKEKAVMYAILKSLGISARDIKRMVERGEIQKPRKKVKSICG